MKSNNHINVLSGAQTYFLAVQLFLLGAIGFAAFTITSATRCMVMAMMPDGDEWQPVRSKMALGFGVAGGAFVCAAAYAVQEPMELFPLISVILGTWASSRIKERSHHARLGYILANVNNSVYAAMYAGSYATAFGSFINIMNMMTTMWHEDGLSKGLRHYYKKLRQNYL